MSKSTRGIRAAGVASLAVTLSIGVAAPAFAAAGFEFTRIAGDNRYETAVEASKVYGAAADVIIANGQPGEYADALAGNYLSGAVDAPILLTKRSGLPASTKARLDVINPTKVWVVGGEAAVPAEQVAELEGEGYDVERISGPNRFATNAEVIAADGPATDGLGLIATGLNFPDALSAGPFAYQGHSLGLSRTDSLPDVVGDALQADNVDRVLIFGGTDAVGAGVVADLTARGITVEERFAGADRSETSELAAEWALANLAFTDEHVGVASGYTDGFGADALAGGPVEGNELSPMLITRNVDNPDDVLDYLEAHSATLADGHIYGGHAAISQAAENAMTEAATGDAPASNQDFTVTPAGNRTDETGGTDVDYTVTGIPAGITTVDISLVACEDVTVSNTGLATFEDDENTAGTDTTVLEGNNKADGVGEEDTPAYFTERNGAAVGNTTTEHLNDVAVVNGSVTFSVNSAEVDCVRAVIFDDANDNDALDLDANNQPTEAFSVTGELQFTAPAATTGPMDENVTSTDKANNKFTGCEITTGDAGTGAETVVSTTECFTFSYDSNDRFFLGDGSPANQLTLEEFESKISPDDDVSGDYNANASLVSTFILTDEAPAPATNVVATSTTTDSVKVTWDDSATTTVDSYNIYRFRTTSTQTTCPLPETTQSLKDADGDTYTLLANVADESATPGSDGKYSYTDSAVAAGATYCYLVRSVDDGDEGINSNTDDATVPTTNPPAETVRPFSEDAVVTSNGPGLANTFGPGDVFKVVFNEVMAVPNSGDTIRARDEDGANDTIADFINGTNSAFTLNATAETVNGVSRPAGTVLTVTVGPNGPTIVAAGDTAGLQIPATVIDQSGNTDLAGNQWDLSKGDVVLDQDADDSVASFSDTTAPDATSAAGTDGGLGTDTIVVTYNEGVRCPTTEPGQFVYDPTTAETTTATTAATGISCSGSQATLTFPTGTFVSGVTVDQVVYTQSTTAANRVEDMSGNDAVSPDPVAVTG